MSGTEPLGFDLEGERQLLLLLPYRRCFEGDKCECSETAAQDEVGDEPSGAKHTQTFLQPPAEEPMDFSPGVTTGGAITLAKFE